MNNQKRSIVKTTPATNEPIMVVHRSWRPLLVVLIATSLLALSGPIYAEAITRQSISFTFDDWSAQGEITYPADGLGPFPTVILVHGSGITDMDHTILDMDYMTGQVRVLSANFADIADYLSANGFAVVRYNKRFVNGPNNGDFIRYNTELTLQALAEDLITVVESVKSHSAVDPDAIYLYGWSEGSTVAAHVATVEADLAGLILQTPVVFPWKENFEYQMYDVGISYLRGVLADSGLGNDDLYPVLLGDGGIVAKSILNYVVDPMAAQTGTLKINPALDVNGDGQLDLDGELIDGLAQVLQFAFSDMGYFRMYQPHRALPVLLDQVEKINLPVLILQGSNDANTPAHGAQQLADALKKAGVDVTLHMYDGLGHSLGPAKDVVADNFAPIDEEPLQDLVAWLSSR